MEDLYRIANDYYIKLESFKAYGGFKSYNFYILLIASVGFIYFTASFFNETVLTHSEGTLFTLSFGLSLFFEAIIIPSMANLKKKRIELLIKTTNKVHGSQATNENEAKVILLKSYFSCDQHKFSNLSEEILGMLNRASLNSSDKTKIERFFSFIYNEDAKTRILTLFVLLCSIITILSSNAGRDIDLVIDVYSSIESSTIIGFSFLTVSVILTLGYGLVLIYRNIQKILLFISLLFVKETTKNALTVKYLAKDLNNYHLFTKSKDEKIIILQ